MLRLQFSKGIFRQHPKIYQNTKFYSKRNVKEFYLGIVGCSFEKLSLANFSKCKVSPKTQTWNQKYHIRVFLVCNFEKLFSF